MTLPPEKLKEIFKTASDLVGRTGSRHFPRCRHQYGRSFYLAEKRGAQKIDHIKNPDSSMFFSLFHGCQDRIKFVTLAPELPGSLSFIDAVKDIVSVSLGHSSADYDAAAAGFSHGADHVTHLFNGMEPFLHRNPGIVGAAADACAASRKMSFLNSSATAFTFILP